MGQLSNEDRIILRMSLLEGYYCTLAMLTVVVVIYWMYEGDCQASKSCSSRKWQHLMHLTHTASYKIKKNSFEEGFDRLSDISKICDCLSDVSYLGDWLSDIHDMWLAVWCYMALWLAVWCYLALWLAVWYYLALWLAVCMGWSYQALWLAAISHLPYIDLRHFVISTLVLHIYVERCWILPSSIIRCLPY